MENNQPFVSIIIPMYNSGRFIAASIESALNQSWQNLELIVVDDGSSDNSVEIAESFLTDSRLKLIRQSNAGACRARNNGFQHSNGDYIQFLDSDDLLSVDKIRSQLILLQNAAPGSISSCGWGKFSEDHEQAVFQTQKVWKDYQPVDWLVDAWTGGGMMQTACWLVPRKLIIEAGPWNEELKSNPNDDGEFFCRVLLKSTAIKFDKGSFIYYREHAGERVSKGQTFTAVNSLLETCYLYQKNIFEAEYSNRTRDAIAFTYASFIYEFFDQHPQLAAKAFEYLNQVQRSAVPQVGGKYFQVLSRLFGFRRGLSIRRFFRGLKRGKKVQAV